MAPGVDSASDWYEYQERPGGKGWIVRKAGSLTAICGRIV
jgi:hypothetical protein